MTAPWHNPGFFTADHAGMGRFMRGAARCWLIALTMPILGLTSCGADNGATPLFDGQTLQGWEGDIPRVWRVEAGAIVGGSLQETVPHNFFLCTEKAYANFVLKLKIRLTGEEGFINSGIQFRSKRLQEPPYEMEGYQADWGEGYWAGLYDESRRNLTLAQPDSTQILDWIRKNDWNDYEIRAEGHRIQLFINGHQTVDYLEEDRSLPQSGLIGIQIHGGGKALVEVKELYLEALKAPQTRVADTKHSQS